MEVEKNYKSKIIKNDEEFEDNAVDVEFISVCANWVRGHLPPTITNASFSVNKGQLCALIGPVGSGKSSILQIILREMSIGSGCVTLSHKSSQLLNVVKSKGGYIKDNPNLTISYASQNAWLFSGTVKQNILFGEEYDKTRYTKVSHLILAKFFFCFVYET